MSRLVVVADANSDRANRIREVCAVRGYATRAVANGADALEACVAELPEVLVAVGELELIEASKLVEILRTNPRTRRTRFVFVGGSESAHWEEWGAEHLPLDSEPDEVAETVAGLVARSSELDAVAGESREEVEGRLAQIPLADLLQLFHLNRRTGSFDLRRRTPEGRTERGRIYLRDGDVVQAQTGAVEGEKALFRLLSWADGGFAFRSESVELQSRINSTTRALLMEGLRQLDEWRRMRAELPSLDAHVTLKVRSGELPNVVHPLTQEVLLLLELYSQVGELVDHASFPDYQVLRTLQTLVERGIVEVRAAPPARPPDSGLFRPAQIRRLRDWLASSGGDPHAPRDAKLLLTSAEPGATEAFLRILEGVPGLQPHPRMTEGLPADGLMPIARLALDEELGIEFLHVPADPAFAPLWPLAAHGALGTLLLLEEPVAEAGERLRPFCETVGALARSRLFHLLLLHPKKATQGGGGGMVEEIRKNVSMVEDSELFLLPVGRDKEPVELLRSAFSRLLP